LYVPEEDLAENKVEDKLPWHDVAVVVFARAQGVDYFDASHVAQRAISESLMKNRSDSSSNGYKMSVLANFRDESRTVEIHKLMEVGIAVGNGYLWTSPTKKAFPRQEDDEE
jgi:hypothetical protein